MSSTIWNFISGKFTNLITAATQNLINGDFASAAIFGLSWGFGLCTSVAGLTKFSNSSTILITHCLTGWLIGVAITSTFHWVEDTYFTEETKWIGPSFIKANRLHHSKPTAMAAHSIWKNVGWRLWLPLAFLNFTLPCKIISVVASSQIIVAIWIHRWIHDKHRPQWVQQFMNWSIFPTLADHHIHHDNDAVGYVIYPAWLDTVLDTTKFWRGIEYIIFQLSGAQPRLHKIRHTDTKKIFPESQVIETEDWCVIIAK